MVASEEEPMDLEMELEATTILCDLKRILQAQDR
jgi:hypothetical protein